MSRLVLPPVAAAPGTYQDEVLHLVPAGKTGCQACGSSKFRMGFHYTDEPQLWLLFAERGESFAMYDPEARLLRPYVTCSSAHGTHQ
jgi:hypothetical protein